jgi:peptidoglycan/xylan/chitin deacetylase (PgdA/CDA1 family)
VKGKLNRKSYSVLNVHHLLKEKVVCLTLDVESDYAGLLEKPSYQGLDRIETLIEFIEQKNLPLTCFVQGSLFETHPDELTKLAAVNNVEFELHSYFHDETKGEGILEIEIGKGREAFKKFVGKPPSGYRSPLGVIRKRHYEVLRANNFKFDSSVFPSIRPGVFQNLDKPTMPYLVKGTGIIEFPFSVFSSFFRVPIGLSYIKLFGRPYLSLLKASKLPDFIVFGFHIHDLFDLSSSRKVIPRKFSSMERIVFNRLYKERQKNGLSTLDKVVNLLIQKGYKFSTLGDVYEVLSEEQERSQTAACERHNR